ncbi:MATE family efflux transporter [Tepiditoga spiralis]|uniref:MATE family efflux transporter n=1 Tax=Tepiditoga spiralis TaxID=2108365 RepID=A0A7G1G6K1_9BACT|nr:MATE family efflux transporter [Tepiditoga spiralis]BBE30976.1 MATE family efflux transporter [Tepiditoga spiralis]
MARDLTKGSIIKELLLMSIPTMIGFSAQMIYDLVDMFWIGHISTAAQASVGIFATIFWVVEALNEIIGTSSISLISQSYGKKDYEKTNLAIEQTITFKFVVAIIGAISIALFLKPLMGSFAKKEVVDLGIKYGYIRLFFLPIMFSSFSVNTALRCIGDSKTPMYIMIFSSILNIILDPFLMFKTIPGTSIQGLNMGISGAAVSTIISQSIAFIIGFYLLFSGKRGIKPSIFKLLKLNFKMDKKLITIGLPNGLEVFARNLSMLVILKFVSLFGTTVVAAYAVGGRIFGFVFMPLMGLSMGASSIIGQSLGANLTTRAAKTAKLTASLASLITFTFMLLVFFKGEVLISFLNSDAQVILYGKEFMIFSSIGLIFVAYSFGLSSVFSASGYNLPFLFMSAGSRWLIQIPLLFIFIKILNLPLIWVWLSFAFGDFFEFLISIYFYTKGKWKKIRT